MMQRRGGMKACKAIRGLSTDERHVQVCLPGLIRQRDEVNMDRRASPSYCMKGTGLLWIRLKCVDHACGANESPEEGRVCPPPRPDVEHDVASVNQRLGNSNNRVTRLTLTRKIEPGAHTWGRGAGEADRSADEVDELDGTEPCVRSPPP